MAYAGPRRALLSGVSYRPFASWDFTGGTLPSWVSFARASNATNFNSAGNLVYAPNQQIRNNGMAGVVAGTPGTVPTNWVFDSTLSTGDCTRQIIGTGIDSATGQTYLDINFSGTSSSSSGRFIFFEANNVISSSVGQYWFQTSSLAVVGTSTGLASALLSWEERSSGGSDLASHQSSNFSSSLTTSLQTFTQTASATAQATVAYTQPGLRLQFNNGVTFNVTIRIGLQQFALVTPAQSSIPNMPASTSAAYYGPRFDYNPSTLAARGLLLEGARTNSIRNSTIQGAAAGTPGTLPTNWSNIGQLGTATGLTTSISGTGTENGINYIDFNIAGTISGGQGAAVLIFDATNQISAATAQNWNSSFYFKLSGGSVPAGLVSQNVVREYTAANAFVTQTINTTSNPTSSNLSASRRVQTVTLSGGGTTAFAINGLRFDWTGVATSTVVNFTFRIAAPQFELLSSSSQTASSPIPTYGSALTRAADIATLTGAAATVLSAAQGTALVETVLLSPASSNNRILGQDTSGYVLADNGSGFAVTSNGSVALLTSGSSPPWTTGVRTALGWSAAGRSITATGTTLASDANVKNSASVYALSSTNGSLPADGWYSRAAFYKTRLPDAILTNRVVLGSGL